MDPLGSAAHSVVGGILVRQGEALLCRRSAHRPWYPGVWDLPGGHVEPGESPQDALIRELNEEISVKVRRLTDECHMRVFGDDFDMRVWVITEWTGDPKNASPIEHDEIAWFSEPEAVVLNLADPSYPTLISDAFARVRLQRLA